MSNTNSLLLLIKLLCLVIGDFRYGQAGFVSLDLLFVTSKVDTISVTPQLFIAAD